MENYLYYKKYLKYKHKYLQHKGSGLGISLYNKSSNIKPFIITINNFHYLFEDSSGKSGDTVYKVTKKQKKEYNNTIPKNFPNEIIISEIKNIIDENIENFYVKILKNPKEKTYYSNLVTKLGNYIPKLYNTDTNTNIMITENVGKRDKDSISNELYKIFEDEKFLGDNDDLKYFDKGIFLLKILIVLMNFLKKLGYGKGKSKHCDLHPKNIFISKVDEKLDDKLDDKLYYKLDEKLDENIIIYNNKKYSVKIIDFGKDINKIKCSKREGKTEAMKKFGEIVENFFIRGKTGINIKGNTIMVQKHFSQFAESSSNEDLYFIINIIKYIYELYYLNYKKVNKYIKTSIKEKNLNDEIIKNLNDEIIKNLNDEISKLEGEKKEGEKKEGEKKEEKKEGEKKEGESMKIFSWNIGTFDMYKRAKIISFANNCNCDTIVFCFQEISRNDLAKWYDTVKNIKKYTLYETNKTYEINKDNKKEIKKEKLFLSNCGNLIPNYKFINVIFILSKKKICDIKYFDYCLTQKTLVTTDGKTTGTKGFISVYFTIDESKISITNVHLPFNNNFYDMNEMINVLNKNLNRNELNEYNKFIVGDVNSRSLFEGYQYKKNIDTKCGCKEKEKNKNTKCNDEYCRVKIFLENLDDINNNTTESNKTGGSGEIMVSYNNFRSISSLNDPLTKDNVIKYLYYADVFKNLIISDDTNDLNLNKLDNFKENNINFLPTYKFDNYGNYKLSKSGKGRLPGYADRIFYFVKKIKIIEYNSLPSVRGNDHIPVFADILL